MYHEVIKLILMCAVNLHPELFEIDELLGP